MTNVVRARTSSRVPSIEPAMTSALLRSVNVGLVVTCSGVTGMSVTFEGGLARLAGSSGGVCGAEGEGVYGPPEMDVEDVAVVVVDENAVEIEAELSDSSFAETERSVVLTIA